MTETLTLHSTRLPAEWSDLASTADLFHRNSARALTVAACRINYSSSPDRDVASDRTAVSAPRVRTIVRAQRIGMSLSPRIDRATVLTPPDLIVPLHLSSDADRQSL